jgi:hypothetical protein
MAGFYEHGNSSSGSIKFAKFEQLVVIRLSGRIATCS